MRRKRKQLSLPLRTFRVMGDGFADYEVMAANAAAARWKAFRSAQEAGYFADPRDGFQRFLQHGFRVSEVIR